MNSLYQHWELSFSSEEEVVWASKGNWLMLWGTHTAQKMKFSIKDFFSKCDQICSFLLIWSHLLKKSLMENFILSAMSLTWSAYFHCYRYRLRQIMNKKKIIIFSSNYFCNKYWTYCRYSITAAFPIIKHWENIQKLFPCRVYWLCEALVIRSKNLGEKVP